MQLIFLSAQVSLLLLQIYLQVKMPHLIFNSATKRSPTLMTNYTPGR